MNKILLLSIVILCSSCSLSKPKKYLNRDDLQPILQYQGFSIKRPESYLWHLYPKTQQPRHAIFFRWCNGYLNDTLACSIHLVKINFPLDSRDLFNNAVRWDTRLMVQHKTAKIINYTNVPILKQGQWCLQQNLYYKIGNVYIREWGYTCLHPTFSQAILDVVCKIEKRNPITNINKIVEDSYSFINRISLESAPGIPIK